MSYIILAWIALAGFTYVSLPLKYPYQASTQMIDSGVVVGLVLPLAVMSRLLDEGPSHLVTTASRRLATARLAWAAAFTLGTFVASTATYLATPVPYSLFVSDALFLSALTVLGTSLLDSAAGWTLPLCAALIGSGPSLIPWQANLLYREHSGSKPLLLTLVVRLLGFISYSRLGAQRRYTAEATSFGRK